MARLIILGATGSLGRHVLSQALDAGHQVTVLVRTPAKLPLEAGRHVSIHTGDLSALAPADLAGLISGHDALINGAGHVTEGEGFVNLIDRVVTSVELLRPLRPVCWFLAGAALLDIDGSGRRGVELPKVKSTYWPHRINFERLARSALDWRLLCPGPMVEQPVLGLERLRISLDTLPVQVPAFARALPAPLLVPLFASLVPQMIVPYADAAALMLANIDPGNEMMRRRVGLALPAGMRGRKSEWAAKPTTHRTPPGGPMMKRIRAALAVVTAGALLMFSAAQAPAAASA
jgi:putative NADH-flavin reductase